MKKIVKISSETILSILNNWAQEQRNSLDEIMYSKLLFENKKKVYTVVFLPINVNVKKRILNEIYEKAPCNGWSEVLNHWEIEGRDNYIYKSHYMGYRYLKLSEDDIMSILADWGYDLYKWATSCTIETKKEEITGKTIVELLLTK